VQGLHFPKHGRAISRANSKEQHGQEKDSLDEDTCAGDLPFLYKYDISNEIAHKLVSL
jgi:hypothetical protein